MRGFRIFGSGVCGGDDALTAPVCFAASAPSNREPFRSIASTVASQKTAFAGASSTGVHSHSSKTQYPWSTQSIWSLHPVIVVEHHHEVLPHWAACRRTQPAAPRLLTLDHHTDTSRPFRRHLRRQARAGGHRLSDAMERQLSQDLVAQLDPMDPRTIEAAMETLGNDEHVVAAIGADIIRSAFVIAHNAANTAQETYLEHKIICRGVDELRRGGRVWPQPDNVLETEFLAGRLQDFDDILQALDEPLLRDAPFILDIDLDYFNTLRSVRPDAAGLIRALAQEAVLVTVATEPEFVAHCAVEPGVTWTRLLADLRTLLGTGD